MFEINENMLLDTFSVSGKTLGGLKKVIDAFNSIYVESKIFTGDIIPLSYKDKGYATYEVYENGKPVFDNDGNKKIATHPVVRSYMLAPGQLPGEGRTWEDCIVRDLEKTIATPELLREWTENTKLAIRINDESGEQKFYLTAGSALQTSDRFGISGDCVSEPCKELHALLAHRFERDFGVTVIAREVNDTRKIFAITSDKYTHIDQNSIFDVVKEIEENGEMGSAKCHQWTVDNFLTRLYIEFPQKAEEFSKIYDFKREMIPGLMFTTSDTGDSSFKVCGTWRIEGSNSLIIHSEIKRKHIGTIDSAKILDEISKHIFAEYAKLPDALCKLMLHDITDPAWDLSDTTGRRANQMAIEEVIKSAFKKLGIVKAIGKKSEKALREAMMSEFDTSLSFTAYDIAMSIMHLPERAMFMDKTKNLVELQKACGNAPFIDYNVDETVVLTA